MMYGWRGKVLRVDLTTGKLWEKHLDPDVIKTYIGGRGLGIYYLNREVDPKCDPFSPDNLLIMATGPLTLSFTPMPSTVFMDELSRMRLALSWRSLN